MLMVEGLEEEMGEVEREGGVEKERVNERRLMRRRKRKEGGEGDG